MSYEELSYKILKSLCNKLQEQYQSYYNCYVIDRYPMSIGQKIEFEDMRHAVECLARWKKTDEKPSFDKEMEDGLLAYTILYFLADIKFANRYQEKFWDCAKVFKLTDEERDELCWMNNAVIHLAYRNEEDFGDCDLRTLFE